MDALHHCRFPAREGVRDGGIVLADIDGDGAIDIVSKVWNTDWNEGGHNYHVDYWRNDIRRQG